MTKIIGILIGKFIIKFMKLLKYNSSVYPGYIVRKIFPNILSKIKYPDLSIMVTGSSGKGSTTKIITELLKENGYTVTHNVEGSNLINAFTTTIINNCSLGGKVKTDALVFEVDERFLKEITRYISPKYLVINNITRDQPPRQGSFDEVFNEIVKGINDNIHLIVNGDDPITKRFSLYHNGKITYFGINKSTMSFLEAINYTKDYLYCPKCNNKLKFDYYHYGSVGKFECKKCDFKRDNIDYCITNIDIDKKMITINNKFNINIDNYILFNLYNICATFSICDLIGIDKNNIVECLNKNKVDEKIFYEQIIDGRKYVSLNCKAENNATYNLSLIYTALDEETKTIVIGLREISRRYKHFDLSWLWDISFELLRDNNVDKVICAGPYRYDLATRIKYAGIDEKDIIILEDLTNAGSVIKEKTKGTVYGILNFDYVEPFLKTIKEDK